MRQVPPKQGHLPFINGRLGVLSDVRNQPRFWNGRVKTVSSLKHATIAARRSKRKQRQCADIILHHHAHVSDAPQGEGNSLASFLTIQFTAAMGFNMPPFHRYL